MKILNELKKVDKKILKITYLGLLCCILVSLIGCMILSFYHVTGLLFQYNFGITLVRLGIIFFVGFLVIAFAFDKILKDIIDDT